MTKRSRSFRRPLAAGLALTAALTLAACSTPAPEATDGGGDTALRIGFSPFTLQAPALKGLADGLTAAGEAQGDTVVVADPNADPQTQLEQISQWVELEQVDAIWVIPVAGEVIAGVLQDALDKGIVVVASGVPDDYGIELGTPGITFTNIDNADYGSKLGGLVVDCVADRLGGSGEAIYLQSPSGQQSSQELNDAVQAAAEEAGVDIVNTQEAADRLTSAQLVSTALQGNPDANTVIATDDESSLGALDAFKQAGIDPQTSCIVGAGGNDEAKAAVDSGELYGVVAFDFGADLGQNLGQLHKMAADPTAPGEQLTTPILLVTK
jgi:ABC-type sugar transport system substrate-binding protein